MISSAEGAAVVAAMATGQLGRSSERSARSCSSELIQGQNTLEPVLENGGWTTELGGMRVKLCVCKGTSLSGSGIFSVEESLLTHSQCEPSTERQQGRLGSGAWS